MSYMDIYKKRLDRYGLNYQSRIQTERERLFDLYLLKSTYRIDFTYEDNVHPGSFEKYKQDTSETLHYLLTRIDLNIPGGTVLQIPDKDGVLKPWMVYYVEHIEASGYNRYIMLRMSHNLSFVARDGQNYTSYAYLHGKGETSMYDTKELNIARYLEDENTYYVVMPANQNLKRDDYVQVGTAPMAQQFRVTGYDLQSTEGVEYVTLDPTYEYDLTPPPTKQEGDNDEEFFWFTGGVEEAND